MIFLLDQQLPVRLAHWIEAKGHRADHVRRLALDQADDTVIWREAARLGAVVISKDADFASPSLRGVQVVWVRTGNCSNDALIARFDALWLSLMAELEAGAPLLELR